MVERQKKAYGQGGFTLIEIIAVLVIIGILAIVAVPKYLDMQNAARKKAAAGLVAAAQSQLSLGFANAKLNNTTFDPGAECNNVNGTVSGNGTIDCGSPTATDAVVNINATVEGQKANGTWANPGVAAAASGGDSSETTTPAEGS